METQMSEKATAHCINVIADHRESHSPVWAALSARGDVRMEARQLAVGDYEVGGRCLIERKTVVDLAQSIVDGRLFHQVYRLRNSGWPCAVIVEGRMADLVEVHVRREAIQGAMITLALVHQVPVFRALDADETARLLVYVGRQLERDEVGPVLKRKRRCSQRRRAQLLVLQSMPGIGPKRAVSLLDRFGSVKAVVNASSEALAGVPGMGLTVIHRVQWATGEERLEGR
jgi:DNA excision repair protein ERCC-4